MRSPDAAASARDLADSDVIKLAAIDMDGTLLNARGVVSVRTVRALEAAAEAGVHVVPASGRQPFSIAYAVRGTFLARGTVLGANGAVATDLGTGRVLFQTVVEVDAQVALYRGLRHRFPGVRCASVRDGGDSFFPEHGYVALMNPGDHGRPPEPEEFALSAVLREPSVKLVLRAPGVEPEELLAAALELDVPGCTPTTSGAPFLEVSAAGVTKASGLRRLTEMLGIAAEEVVAFGDNRNDLEMLTWAGHGVAMGNALAETMAVADEVTLSNHDDGVAVVIERLLRTP